MGIKSIFSIVFFVVSLGYHHLWAQKKNAKNSTEEKVVSNPIRREPFRPFQQIDSFYHDVRKVFQRVTSPTKGFIESDFKSAWESLSERNKHKLFDVVSHMTKRGYAAKPHIEDLLGSVTAGVKNKKLDEQHLKRYFEIADTCVELYPKHIAANLFKTTRLFLETDYIYQSKFNSLKVVGGSFRIDHVFDEHLATEERGKFHDQVLAQKPKKEEWFEHLEEEKTSDDTVSTEVTDEWNKWNDIGSSSESSSNDSGWNTADDSFGWSDTDHSADQSGWGDSQTAKSWEENVATFNPGKVEEYENRFRKIHEGVKEITEEDLATRYDAIYEPLPEVKGPFLHFDHVDLKMISRFDSAHIDKVVGKLLMKDYHFVGSGGRMFWSNVGLPEDQVYCELPHYAFNVKNPHIKADHAEMYYKEKVDSVMYGYFYYEIHPHNRNPEKAIYPRFKSYYSNIRVKDLAKDVTYVGGFTLIGKKMYSSSFSHVAARITVKKENKVKFKAYSTSGFTFADSIISSPRAAITIYQANSDSITHAAVSMRYDAKNAYLITRRDKGEYKEASFENTYHQVMIDAEYMKWDLMKDSIDFLILNARDKIPLEVRSEDYFNPYVVPRLTGMLRYNPLIMVCHYSLQKRQSVMKGRTIVDDRNLELKGFLNALRVLHREGFIDYNPYTDKLTIKKKGWLYYYANQRLANPNANSVDFDNFRLTSRIADKPNATLNFTKNELKIRGVKNFIISDSMKVVVQPSNGEVIIQENRKTIFGGTMVSGNLVFRGKEFIFNYDSFLVNMSKVDSISFLVKDSTSDVAKEVPNSLTDTGGVLYLGRRNNKSGLGGSKGFPRFDANVGGVIYFDRPDILGGAYDRRMFFEVPPFKMDSLNDKGMDRSIVFKGKFCSGGIFPDFEEILSMQRDNAFGFVKETPELGYPLFEKTANAKYYGKIQMNSRGLRGNGKIEHLAGVFYSPDFVFYPDSVLTKDGGKGIIASSVFQNTPYPSVAMNAYEMRWLLHQDSMVIKSKPNKPFEMYDPTSTFAGTLVMRKNEMLGKGIFETMFSSDSSKSFQFKQTEYLSKNSTFKIKSKDPKIPGMVGQNVLVNYDLAERVAIIKGMKQGQKSFSFPYSEYITDINTVIWNLDQGKLVMSGENDGLGKFVSTQKQQYGLEFEASSAVYDLEHYTLKLFGVPRIKVANANIIPDYGEVTVRKGGELDSLINARVEMNGFSKFHVFHQANIKIVSAREFRGNAVYDYVNDIGKKMPIKFDRFKIEYAKDVPMDKAGVDDITIKAYGTISEKTPIKLIAGVDYAGDVKAVDKDDFLHFRGKARLDINRPNNVWFTHESNDSISHGVITIDKNLTEAGMRNRLKTGIYLSKLSKQIYPAFIEFVKNSDNDTPILEMNGILSYNDTTKEYTTIYKERVTGASRKGNCIRYNYERKKFDFDGILNLVEIPENEKFSLLTAGVGRLPIGTTSLSMTSLFYLKFDAESSIHKTISRSFEEGKYADEMSVTKPDILKLNLGQILEDDQFKKWQEDDTKPFARYLKNGIVFSEVAIKWSNEANAFISEGKLGLYSVFGEEIDTKVEGYIEIPKKENETTANIYFVNNSGTWFFFGIRKNNLISLSSNSSYNQALSKAKSTLKKADLEEVANFVNSFRTRYLGLEPIEFTLSSSSTTDLQQPSIEENTAQEQPSPENQPDNPPTEEKTIIEEEKKKEKKDNTKKKNKKSATIVEEEEATNNDGF